MLGMIKRVGRYLLNNVFGIMVIVLFCVLIFGYGEDKDIRAGTGCGASCGVHVQQGKSKTDLKMWY